MGFTQGINGAGVAGRGREQEVKLGVELLMMEEGVKWTFHDDGSWTDLADGGTMVARANVCATGVEWRHLNLPNEDKLLGRGLYYGAGASEAPLCGGEDVYVVGGGNSAGQAVMHLAKHAKSVTMLVRDKALAASMSQYLSDRILGAANVQVRYDFDRDPLRRSPTSSRPRRAQRPASSRRTPFSAWRDRHGAGARGTSPSFLALRLAVRVPTPLTRWPGPPPRACFVGPRCPWPPAPPLPLAG